MIFDPNDVCSTALYVIERKDFNGESEFWACSSEHGTGWHPRIPKQSFSPSELTKAIRFLIDNEWFQDCTIRQLLIRGQKEHAWSSTPAS